MNGFGYFDAIRYICPIGGLTWEGMQARFQKLDIASRVEPVFTTPTPAEERIGVLLAHRDIVRKSSEQGAKSVLVLSDDVHFLDSAADLLPQAVAELEKVEWTLFYLGGWSPSVLEPKPGCRFLDQAREVSVPHAVAYHHRVFPRVLADWPTETAEVADWVARSGGVETYLANIEDAVVAHPVLTTVPALLPFEAADMQRRFTI